MSKKLHFLASLVTTVAMLSTFAAPARAAGDLAVELVDGVLYIVGDKEDNWISIAGPEGWDTVLVGEDIFRPFDTIAEFPLSEVSEVVVIAGGGADIVVIRGYFDGDGTTDISIDTGRGEDIITTFNSKPVISGNLLVNTGLDHDYVDLSGVSIHGAMEISTGQGPDELYLIGNSDVVADTLINMGVDDDVMYVDGKDAEGNPTHRIHGNLEVQMGQGSDTVTGLDWGWDPALGPDLAIDGFALFVGGQGFDTFVDPSTLDVDPENLEILGFEAD